MGTCLIFAGTARRLSPFLLVLAFLASVYWGTFSRELTGGTHDDPANLMWRATQFEVAHTNGYPLFSCLLRLLYECVPADKFITWANASSAVFALITISLGYVLLRGVGISQFSIVAWMLFIGLGETFWSQALFCEVYHFSHVLLLGSLLALLECYHHPQPGRFFWVGVLCGLQLTHHLLAAPFALISIALAVFFGVVRSSRPVWSSLCLLLGLCLGLLPYLYIPISWWSHGLSWTEGLYRHGKLGLGNLSMYSPFTPFSSMWRQTSYILLQDLGLPGLIMASAGIVIALCDPACIRRRLTGLVLVCGGVVAPIVYLLRFRPWASSEILAFYLLPLFCLSLFLPFALDALWSQIQGLPVRKSVRILAFGLVSAIVFLSLYVRLVENYPRLKQCHGDLRYVAIRETLKSLQPGDTVLSYGCAGSFQFWKLIALSTGLHDQLQWGSFSEDNDRASPSQCDKLKEFLKALDSQKRQFFVLTDSPEIVLPELQGRRLKVETLFKLSAHEMPEFTLDADGQVLPGPRNWLELLSGQLVWELGIGFPSGHLANNLALRWFCIPGSNPDGKIVFSNEFGSNRYVRQRIYAVNGSFYEKSSGERIDLDMDPMNHGKVIQSWLRKERVDIPFGLKIDYTNPPQGVFVLGQIGCFPPFEPTFESRPVVQSLFRVSK